MGGTSDLRVTERTIVSQLPGKDISISFLEFCPYTGVTDKWPQKHRHDHWSYGFLLYILTLKSYYLLALILLVSI